MINSRLLRVLAGAPTVLFLCSGNVIRSAFADLYTRHLGCPLEVRSGATLYRHPRIHPLAARALIARGVARAEVEAFRPTHLDDLLGHIPPAALVLGMTREHLAALPPELSTQAFLTSELVGELRDIDDPILDGRFEQAFERIAACSEALVRARAGSRIRADL